MSELLDSRKERILTLIAESGISDPRMKTLNGTWQKLLLDNSDIMFIFNICAKTAYRWRKSGKLLFHKVSGRCYYSWEKLIPRLEKIFFDL